MKSFLTTVLAYVQRNEKVCEDTSDIEGDEYDDGIVAPFGGEPLLGATTGFPNPGTFTVDGEDVLADVVFTLGEYAELLAVGVEEGCADSGWAVVFYVVVVHGVLRCSVGFTDYADQCEVAVKVNCRWL